MGAGQPLCTCGHIRKVHGDAPKDVSSVVGAIVAVAILVVLIGGCMALVSGGDESDDGSGPTPAAEEQVDEPASEGYIEVVPERSRCVQDFVLGDLIFYVALRNTGAASEKVDVQPIRYYVGGDENRSPFDEMLDVEVPADGRMHPAWHRYKVEEGHVVERCAAQISGAPNLDDSEEIEIPVRE